MLYFLTLTLRIDFTIFTDWLDRLISLPVYNRCNKP